MHVQEKQKNTDLFLVLLKYGFKIQPKEGYLDYL